MAFHCSDILEINIWYYFDIIEVISYFNPIRISEKERIF